MKSLRLIVFSIIPLLLFGIMGCEKEGTTDVQRDTKKAQERVVQANQSLMLGIANIVSNPNNPSSFNLSSAYSLYTEALSYDPDNLDAHFGAALTSVLTLFSDSTLQSLGKIENPIVSVTESIQLSQQSVVALLTEGQFKRVTQLLQGTATFNVHALLKPSGRTNKALAKSKANEPMPSYYQNIIETKVLPVFTKAITHLQRITQNQNYVFLITPEMTGGQSHTTYRIDLTEIYLFQAVCQAITAYGSLFISYNIDYNSLSDVDVVQAWSTGSPFLALRTNGTQHMKNVRTNVIGAAQSVKNGITFLMNEPPHQETDIIKYNPQQEQELLNEIESANHIIAQFSGPTTSPYGTINLVNLFDNPIQDFKTKIPAYTVTAHFNVNTGKYDAILTWQASTFSSWVFPDPTFNGVLPEMTDPQLKQLLEINASNWKSSITISG